MRGLDVAVIGAGIQGTCIALELSLRGARVVLYEQGPTVLGGVSRENEGKIHLGFVYANDPSLATARLMATGGVRFFPLMRRWLESDRFALSSPFYYAVHRRSLLPVDALAATYERMREEIRAAASAKNGSYFGIQRPDSMRRLPKAEVASHFDDSAVSGAFESAEVAVDPRAVAGALATRAAEDPSLEIRLNTKVRSVSSSQSGLSVVAGGVDDGSYDHVVNAAWGGRLAIDASIGIRPNAPWSFRMKHFFRGRGRVTDVPSATIVLGGFGDVVSFGEGDTYVSWYPVARRGWSTELTPPAWLPCPPDHAEIAREMVDQLSGVVPSVRSLLDGIDTASGLSGGLIYAQGDTDVDDPTSRLHERHSVGPVSHGCYHTVDTGKYSLAPLFAEQLADRICASEA